MHNLNLAQWGLPAGVLEHYKKKGVMQMFPWQLECLTTEKVLEGENLVYSAPTSAGKTLVAEILIAQTVFDRNKKALIILPYVSVVREKMFYFQDMFSANGVRVEGYMGGHTPSASFQQVNVGVCTIEKANSLINRLLEEKNLVNLGIVVVDELHMLGDPYRGYLLELLLTKLLYMSSVLKDLKLQIVGMSATLPNLNMLAKWLKARLYFTDFRPIPLQERLKCGRDLYNAKLEKVGEIATLQEEASDDSEEVGQMCIETFQNGHSVLIFCPTKVWCESLSMKLAVLFRKLGCSESALKEGSAGWVLRQQLDLKKINEVISHLKMSPVGLDKDLAKTVSYGVAFHHAGLTLDERDIIEGSFRNGSLRVVCATSTLSSGVNLPARRVIIRSAMSHGGIMDILTYRQMIGRAGRMGKDTEGESILICKPTEKQACRQLMAGGLKPIESCLGSGRLSASLKRAILEIIASGIATSPDQVASYAASTFLASSSRGDLQDPLKSCLEFLEESELIRLQSSGSYAPTPLGQACLASSLPPDEGLALFRELERARRCFVLDSDLHIIYQVTPYSVSEQWSKIDWLRVLNILEELSPSMRRVADLVGVQDSFLVKVVKGSINLSLPEHRSKLSIHRRFYTSLALQDLVNEVPLPDVARKFDCSKGMLQSLQQSSATYAGMVAEFARRLRWDTIEVIVSQFHERLQFGVQKELCELMRLSSLNGVRARTLFNSGFTTLADIANSDVETLEAALLAVTPFQTKLQIDGETGYEFEHRTRFNTVWVTGKTGLSIRQAAEDLINEARDVLELELGVAAVWGKQSKSSSQLNTTKVEDASSYGETSVCDKEQHCTNIDDNITKKSDCLNINLVVLEKQSGNTHGEHFVVAHEYSKSENDNEKKGADENGSDRKSHCTTENETALGKSMEMAKLNKSEVIESINAVVDHGGVASSVLTESKDAYEVITIDSKPDTDNVSHTRDAIGISKPIVIVENNEIKDVHMGDIILNTVCDWDSTKLGKTGSTGNKCVNQEETREKLFKEPTLKNIQKSLYNRAEGVGRKENIEDHVGDVILSTCEWNFSGVEKILLDEENANRNTAVNNVNPNLIGEEKAVDPHTSKNYSHDINYFEATLNAIAFKSPVSNSVEPRPVAVVARSRYSTDIFEESPKPSSTPVAASRVKTASLQSPDLFSQSLTFDTQMAQLCDLEDAVDDNSNSPQKSDDHGFFSETSPVIIAEVSYSDRTPCNLDAKEKMVVTEARKRKASPDIIAGSDDSTAEENPVPRRLCFAKKGRAKRRKEDVPLVSLLSSDEDDAEIASTPQMPRSLSLRSPKRGNDTAKLLSLASPKRGTQALLTRIKGLGYSGPVPKTAKDTNAGEPMDVFEAAVSTEKAQKDSGPSDDVCVIEEQANPLALSDINWETLNFVDVCGNPTVFKSFRKEITNQRILGIAVGIKKVVNQKKAAIGSNFLRNGMINEKEENNGRNERFCYDDLVLDGVAFYWNENNVFYMKMNSGVSNDDCINVLKSLKTMSNRTIRIFDAKEHLKTLALCTGVIIDGCFEDPKVASWLVSTVNQELGLRCIVAETLPPALKLVDAFGPFKGTSSPSLNTESQVPVKTRACIESYLAYYLMEAVMPLLQSNCMLQLFNKIEMPTIRILVEMEQAGFRFDEVKLKEAKSELESLATKLEQRAHALAGRRFALSSYAAVGKVIHTELRLGKGLLDPKKKHGTGKDILELLSHGTKHPLPGVILQWRKVKAIITKVVFPLLQLLPNTRVHGSSQTFTVTGRISMKEPNMQNVPRDFDVTHSDGSLMGSLRLRDMFISSDNTVLLSADYCQVELRLLACLCKDSALVKAITESADVFVDIAATIHGVDKDQVTSEQRQRAKQTCYGIIYGIGIKSLAQQLQLSDDAAQALHNQFKSNYEGVRQYLLKTVSSCQEKGYVETLSGRRRYLPAINSSNSALRSEAERQAVNTTVQGSAADLVKTAMVKFWKMCNSNSELKEKVRLVLHLHDEVIYEVHESTLYCAGKQLKNCMETAMSLPVPFPVKVRAGTSWGQLAAIES